MKVLFLLLTFLGISFLIKAQEDDASHVFFANQSRLAIDLKSTITGNSSIVEVKKTSFLPYEITHDHTSTIAIGDIVGVKEKDHNENNASLRFDRKRSFGNNTFSSRLEVYTGQDLLFTILTTSEDRSGFYTNVYYNVEYSDGTLDTLSPGRVLKDNKGIQAQVAQKEIVYQGQSYKLVYGVFDENADKTDNLIFSLSNVLDTIYKYDPPIEDTSNPNVLHILTYNPGILMPLNISDQDEDQRAEVLHKAMPKNMDVIVFEEFFEPQKTKQILDSLSPWYPYHTGQHNKILIPGIGKSGGVRIVSKYPILEEDEISYSENGCVPTDFFSQFANKGVKYAKINKNGQILHVFGTHTSLQPCDLYIMGQFIASKNLPKDEIVIMAGDFNVDMNHYKNGSDDYSILLDTLNALEPTYLSFLNDSTYTGSSSGLNHFYCCNPSGRQHLDYVLISSQHKIPYLLTNRSLQARLNEPDASFGIFDMGDHEPVYARIEFPDISSTTKEISSCISQDIILEAQINVSAPYGTIQWYKENIAIPDAHNLELKVQLSSFEDFGNYSCKYQYEYLPDTIINNFFDPSYMSYAWYFRGITPGELELKYTIAPQDSSVECSGIITDIINRKWNQMILYPNPAQQQITLQSDILNEFISFQLIDITGKVYSTQFTTNASNIVKFDISKLPSSVYFIDGQHKSGNHFQKSFVKIP